MYIQEEDLRTMAAGIKVSGTRKGAAVAARPRTQEPDPRTPEGQWALWLRKLMADARVDADKLAKAAGKNRSTIFMWLRGDTVPHLAVWQTLAKAVGKQTWRDLTPPDEFVDQVRRRKR